MNRIHTADAEAEAMLRMHGDSPGALSACLKTVSDQMNVIGYLLSLS